LRRNTVAEPDAYYALLAPLVASLDIWQTEYLHVLEGRDPVKEWTNGTWLKTFLDALAAEERAAFEAAYAARVALAYPPQADGKTLFPFRRIFIVAVAAV
jgi:trans-aconitate 2-methyltransferase